MTPHEELLSKFHEFVPEAVIEELGEELSSECPEWAAQMDLSDDDPYGLDDIAEPAEYFDEYQLAMESNRTLLTIDVPDHLQNTFYGMIFVNLITIMETYLSDTFIGLVPRSERFMRNFVATTPEFKDQKAIARGALQLIGRHIRNLPRIHEERCLASFGNRTEHVPRHLGRVVS